VLSYARAVRPSVSLLRSITGTAVPLVEGAGDSLGRAPQVLDADERQHFDDPRDLVLFAGPLCADPIHRLSGLARH
jgi:hypothetical protein